VEQLLYLLMDAVVSLVLAKHIIAAGAYSCATMTMHATIMCANARTTHPQTGQ
jgi:hypothetical protein